MKSLFKPWFGRSCDAVRPTCESGHVVGRRLALAAQGGAVAREESSLMISEKATAAMDAHFMVARSLIGGEAHLAPARAVALYRSRVQANQQRLSKGA